MKEARDEDHDGDVLAPLKSITSGHPIRFGLIVASLLAILGWGVYAYYLEYTLGLGQTGARLPVVWGLNVIDFVYFIAISMAGTIISGVLRLSHAAWRKPITRIAEMITVAALPVGAVFVMADIARPDRMINLFIYARLQSPISWDTIAIGTYFIASLIYFFLPLIPDLAICRERMRSVGRVRTWLYSRLSFHWVGSDAQVSRLNWGITVMAVIIVPLAVCVHSVLGWIYAVTLRAGVGGSTVFPIYFVVGAVYSGLGAMLVVVYAFRRFYHLEKYIEVKHFLYLGLIFLASDLTMIYLTVGDFMTPAWASQTLDSQYITSLTVGTYAPEFWFTILVGFVLPAIIVALPWTRKIGFIVLAGLLANAGMWVERYLIVVPSMALPELPYPAGVFVPSWEDVSVTVAGFAGFALLLILLTRLVPLISLWEYNGAEGSAEGPTLPSVGSVRAASSVEAPTFPDMSAIIATRSYRDNNDMNPATHPESANPPGSIPSGLEAEERFEI
jgi:molybdopterin-containing oxidoreductase family membrane subunit